MDLFFTKKFVDNFLQFLSMKKIHR